MKQHFMLLLVAIILLVNTTIVMGQAGGQCVTSECHADIGTKKYTHGPVGAGVCNVCHVPTPDKDHEFTLFAAKEELCLGCHETSRDMMLQEHVHSPVLEGNCTGCHDPHQSDFQFTLKGNAADLCYNCHETERFGKEFVHGPVGGGDCNVCHNPHASENENQLVQAPDQLCFLCHGEMVEKMQKRHIHEPVKEKCTNCHDPHSDVAKFMLDADLPQLCVNCHEELAAEQPVKHPPVAAGDCRVCHDVHATDYPRMTPGTLSETCFSCHEDLGNHVTTSEHKHGPIEEGDCNACHNPHGSENYRLLKKYFPHEFYIPYKTENYAICFDCHNKNIALDPKTTTLTDFRDGDVNLHYLHVNKDVKGRSCKACHHPHATDQEKHIRPSVPYGSVNWDLPVEYTKLSDGGSCVVGCHSPKEYRRK
jgi:predicted CXXCH cytochrome family protein